jgi:methionyl-tRNA formyltransferase
MKTVFLGTPEFAVKILMKLKGRHEVVCVVTQPDRPKGRGNTVVSPPVKEFAKNSGIEVLQPEKVKDADFIRLLEKRAAGADVFITAAYGQILPEAVLSMPGYGCINVHASLLPKYRGAAPVQRAIMNGDAVTGVTIMKMDSGLDTGDIITQTEIQIENSDTGGSMLEKMSVAGAYTLMEALDAIEAGIARYTPQDEKYATYAKAITKETWHIRFDLPAKEITDLIRALLPDNPAFTTYTGSKIKILSAAAADAANAADAAAGKIVRIEKDAILVKSADACVLLKEVKPASGKRMSAAAFTRGRNIRVGDCLGL